MHNQATLTGHGFQEKGTSQVVNMLRTYTMHKVLWATVTLHVVHDLQCSPCHGV